MGVRLGNATSKILPGARYPFIVNVMLQNLVAATPVMVVKLADTTNWPHTATNGIDLLETQVNINPDTNYTGDIMLGWLTGVNTLNSDFHMIDCYHLDKKSASPIVDHLNFGLGGVFRCEMNNQWFGPTTSNDTSFQSDVKLLGPDGSTEFYPANGDLVLKVSRTAGSVDVGLVVRYRTF